MRLKTTTLKSRSYDSPRDFKTSTGPCASNSQATHGFRGAPGTPASDMTAFLRNEAAAPGLAKARRLREGNRTGSKATQNVDTLPPPEKNSEP